MQRRHILRGLAALALCPICSSAGFGQERLPFGYSGRIGPDRWGRLNKANAACSAGAEQSPLDIGGATVKADLPKLDISWAKSADTLVNNGHTIQASFNDGGQLAVGGDRYKLLQFHFHHPSEHLIGGRKFPMEVHFVHATPAGGLGVIGVMIAGGRSNAVFNKVVSTVPAKRGPAIKADPAIDPNGLLPSGRNYYAYAGSLTTPPCSEMVSWMLLTDPIEVAEADIAAFGKLYAMNARPAQKPNRRFVLRSG